MVETGDGAGCGGRPGYSDAPFATGTDKNLEKAQLEFSNGEKILLTLQCTDKPQEFVFPMQKCSWVQLTDWEEPFPLSENGVAEWEFYGKDCLEQK